MSLSSDEGIMKRQRVSRACDLCRRKKIKCDGISPVCNNCQVFSLNCSYKETMKKRGPPKGYIEAIENRLYKLESYLHKIVKDEKDSQTLEILKELQSPLETSGGQKINQRPQRRRKQHTTNPSSFSSLLDSSTLRHDNLLLEDNRLTDNTVIAATINNKNTNDDDDNNSVVGQLTMDENGQVHYLGKSSGFYLLSESCSYQNGAFHFAGYGHEIKMDQQKINSRNSKRGYPVDPLELPPKDLSEHLLTTYFTHFYPVLPMFYKRYLVSTASHLDLISPLLLNSIYALASRVTHDERVRFDPNSSDTAGDLFYERARCLLDDYYDTPRISTVQALLLMASHQMGAMKPARAWLYSGMAFRMAQDLGLNRNCDHWNITSEEKERRKRVFWCCYIVDKLTSAIYGRSSNFEERDCDVPLPTVDDDEPIVCKDASRPPVRLLDLFIQSVKVCDILGHVLKNIYYVKARHHIDSQSIDRILNTLHQQLTQWHQNLPSSLQYKLPNTQYGEKCRDPPSPICQLHLMYYTTLILLHRSFIPGSTQKQLSTSLPSYKLCEAAATSVLDIVNIMLEENHLRYVYNFSVFFVFTAGIIFIKLASSSKDANSAFDARINTNRIMRALDELELTWMNAARCCNILGELAGLRDIKVECNRYIPKKEKNSTPPPSIAVPNSPELEPTLTLSTKQQEEEDDDNDNDEMKWDLEQERSLYNRVFSNNDLFSSSLPQVPISSVRHSSIHQNQSASLNVESRQANTYDEHQHDLDQSSSLLTTVSSTSFLGNIKPTMDPFAAPGIITMSFQQQKEPTSSDTASWDMPTSLDIDEWNVYFGNLQQQQTDNNVLLAENNKSLQHDTSLVFIQEQQQQQLSSLELPLSPSQSVLFRFLDTSNPEESNDDKHQNDSVNMVALP